LADFDDVGFSVEAETVGVNGQGAEKLPSGAVFEAGQIGVLVVKITEEGVFVFAAPAFEGFERRATLAVKEVVEQGERQRLGVHQQTFKPYAP
jgi:hypothetical protein